MIKLDAKGIGVDSGTIVIADFGFVNIPQLGDITQELSATFDVGTGKYRVSWSIEHTWNGRVASDNEVELEVPSGRLLVVDPCYVRKDWGRFYRDTDNLKDIEKLRSKYRAILLNKMGGDGTYDVEITLTKEEDAPA